MQTISPWKRCVQRCQVAVNQDIRSRILHIHDNRHETGRICSKSVFALFVFLIMSKDTEPGRKESLSLLPGISGRCAREDPYMEV